MLYAGVASHPLRSEKATVLQSESPTGFAAQVLLAESLLKLPTTLVTVTRDVDKLELAITLQVNFQLALGIDPFVHSSASSSASSQSITYRDDIVHPMAAALVAEVIGTLASFLGLPTVRPSARGVDGIGSYATAFRGRDLR